MAVKPRQGKGCEINIPVAIIDWLQTDGLFAQRFADKDLGAFPEEGSIRVNPLGL